MWHTFFNTEHNRLPKLKDTTHTFKNIEKIPDIDTIAEIIFQNTNDKKIFIQGTNFA